jgi:hypothetical protein
MRSDRTRRLIDNNFVFFRLYLQHSSDSAPTRRGRTIAELAKNRTEGHDLLYYHEQYDRSCDRGSGDQGARLDDSKLLCTCCCCCCVQHGDRGASKDGRLT